MTQLCQPLTWDVLLAILGLTCFTVVATVVVVLKTVRDVYMMRMFHEHEMARMKTRQPSSLQLPPSQGCHDTKDYRGVI